MKKNNKKQSNSIILFSLLGIIVLIIVLLVIRYNTISESYLVCTSNITENYHEELTFRYDIYNKLYSYNRVEEVHDVDEETLNNNYILFMNEYDRIKEELNDNFKYEVNKESNKVVVKTYITVSTYPNFFNSYINNEKITSNTRLTDVKSFLESNNYKCSVTRK